MSLADRLAAARDSRGELPPEAVRPDTDTAADEFRNERNEFNPAVEHVINPEDTTQPELFASDPTLNTADYAQNSDIIRIGAAGQPLSDEGSSMSYRNANKIVERADQIRAGYGPYRNAHENQLWTLPDDAPLLDVDEPATWVEKHDSNALVSKSAQEKRSAKRKADREKINEQIEARREVRAEIIEAGKAHYREKKAAEKAERSEQRQGIVGRLRGLFSRNRKSDAAPTAETSSTPTSSDVAGRAEAERNDTKYTAEEHDTLQKREEELRELDDLRSEYLRRVAGRARRSVHIFKRDFGRKGVAEAQKAYETHRNDIFESELDYLSNELGLSPSEIDQATAAFAFGEQRKLAKELYKHRMEATGNYKIVEETREAENGQIAAWTELQVQKRGPLDKFYEWYGSVNNGGKWYSKGALKKAGAMGVIGGVAGLGIGLVAAPLTAGALAGVGGGVLVSRITKAYMSTHIKRKSEDKNITHADARRYELLHALGEGDTINYDVEMTDLISSQTKTEVGRNRKRTAAVVGATAIGGAIGGGLLHGLDIPSKNIDLVPFNTPDMPDIGLLGIPGIDLPGFLKPDFSHPHMPDFGWMKFWDNDHDQLKPWDRDTDTGTSTGTAGDTPGAGGSGHIDNYVDKPHDGIKANGDVRVPKHGKLGDSFRVEQGSGQIREIQQYAAAHNYDGIDADKATEIWEHMKASQLTDGNDKLINLRGNDDTYHVGSDVRLAHRDRAAEWGNRAIERALREELEKEAA